MRNLLHRIRLPPLQHNLTQPILPHYRGVILLRRPRVHPVHLLVVFIEVVSPNGNVPGKAAEHGAAKVRGAGEDLPVEGALLVPGERGEGGVLFGGGEEVVFGDDLDAVLGGLGGEVVDVFSGAAGGVDYFETLERRNVNFAYCIEREGGGRKREMCVCVCV